MFPEITLNFIKQSKFPGQRERLFLKVKKKTLRSNCKHAV